MPWGPPSGGRVKLARGRRRRGSAGAVEDSGDGVGVGDDLKDAHAAWRYGKSGEGLVALGAFWVPYTTRSRSSSLIVSTASQVSAASSALLTILLTPPMLMPRLAATSRWLRFSDHPAKPRCCARAPRHGLQALRASCGSEWGLRLCRGCGVRYRALTPAVGLDRQRAGNHGAPRSRLRGRRNPLPQVRRPDPRPSEVVDTAADKSQASPPPDSPFGTTPTRGCGPTTAQRATAGAWQRSRHEQRRADRALN